MPDSEQKKRERDRRRRLLLALLLLSPWKVLRVQMALASRDVDDYFGRVDLALSTHTLTRALREAEGIKPVMERLIGAAMVQGYEAGTSLGGRRITSGVQREFAAEASDRAEKVRQLMTDTSRKWLKADPNNVFALSMSRGERAVRFEAGNHFYEGLQRSVWGMGKMKSWITTSDDPCANCFVERNDDQGWGVKSRVRKRTYRRVCHA